MKDKKKIELLYKIGLDGKASAWMQETGAWSLGQEDPLEKEMATHSSTLAWKIQWMEEAGRLQSTGLQRVRHDWVTSLLFTKLEEIKETWQLNRIWILEQKRYISGTISKVWIRSVD